MKVVICIGSSCHLKGSRQIVECFQSLVSAHHLEGVVELSGSFCMGDCVNGVNVMIDDVRYSVARDEAEEFFNKEILAKVRG